MKIARQNLRALRRGKMKRAGGWILSRREYTQGRASHRRAVRMNRRISKDLRQIFREAQIKQRALTFDV